MKSEMLWLSVFAVGCSPEYQYPGASGVGNPVSTVAARIAPAKDATITSAHVFVEGLTLSLCDGETLDLPVDQPLDLLASPPIVATSGDWCGITMDLEPLLTVEGAAENGEGGSFDVSLDVQRIDLTLDEPFAARDTAFVLELGSFGWIGKESLDLERVPSVVIDPSSPEHDRLAESIEDGSALLEDLDRDGRVDRNERSSPLAAGPGWSDYQDD